MNRYLASVPETAFEQVADTLWKALTGEDTAVDGIGEVAALPFAASYALSRSVRFAAFRWWLPSAADDALAAGFCELFFVPKTQAGQARLGVVIAGAAAQPGASPQGVLAPEALLAWLRLALGLCPEPTTSQLPGFVELSAVLASQGLVATASADYREEAVRLRQELTGLQQLLDEQEDELQGLRAQSRELREALRWTRSNTETNVKPNAEQPQDASPVAQTALSDEQDAGDAAAATLRYPDSLAQLPAWAEVNLAGRVHIMPRALNAAKKSLYLHPQRAYAALELLAGVYRDSRRGTASAAELEQALASQGLRLAGSVAPSIAGEQGQAYFVSWAGRRRFLDLHLVRGGGRDERYCLRIYFFWDADTQQVIVGWLPSHLANSLS